MWQQAQRRVQSDLEDATRAGRHEQTRAGGIGGDADGPDAVSDVERAKGARLRLVPAERLPARGGKHAPAALPEHITKIFNAYKSFKVEEEFTNIADLDEIAKKGYSLNIPLYVKGKVVEHLTPDDVYNQWQVSSDILKKSMTKLFETLK